MTPYLIVEIDVKLNLAKCYLKMSSSDLMKKVDTCLFACKCLRLMDVRGENRNMLMLLATYFYLDEHLTDVLVVVVKNQKRKL